jgi:hypothetical protein
MLNVCECWLVVDLGDHLRSTNVFFNWDHRLGFMQICLIQTATSGTDMFFDQYGYDIFRICMDQSDPRKDLQVKSYQHSDKS